MTAAQTLLDTASVARATELGMVKAVSKPLVVVPLTPAAGVRINCGGGQFTDAVGNTWVPDIDFTGTNGGTFATPTAVTGDAPDAPIYQTERWGMDGYEIPVPTAGIYSVKLHLAEINPDSGPRVFSVTCEGQPFLTDYDISAAAGGAFKAVTPSIVVQVTDLKVSLAFSASVGSAKVSAIEVIPGGVLPKQVPPVITQTTVTPLGDIAKGNPASGLGNPAVFTPTAMQLSGPVLLNPMMGAVRREDQEYAPLGGPALHAFKRDQCYWRTIERTKGVYDWSWVEGEAVKAKQRGGTFGFRMPLQGMGDQRVPDYIAGDPGTYGGFWNNAEFVPDLENLEYQKRWDALWENFAAKYKDDPRINMMDVSGYGMWGEAHLYGAPGSQRPASLSALKIIYDAQLDRMPNKLWAMLLGDKNGNMPGVVDYELSKASATRPIAYRGDALGHSSQWDYTAAVAGGHALTAYKLGPVVGEPANLHPNKTGYDPPVLASWGLAYEQAMRAGMTCFMNGNTGSGEAFNQFAGDDQQAWMNLCKRCGPRDELRLVTIPRTIEASSYIKIHWEVLNSGLAAHFVPTLMRWALRDITGHIVWYRDVDSGLRGQQPSSSPIGHDAFFNMPAKPALPSGVMDLVCYHLDAGMYGHPYKLAITTPQDSDGGYTLGQVTVV